MTQLRPMLPSDYAPLRGLWERTEGLGLNESDEEAPVHAFLERNPGLSVVAVEPAERIVAGVLCGHDGRRGYLHHLAVEPGLRGTGVGRRLLEHCLASLSQLGIPKCNVFVYTDNETGMAFWEHAQFAHRRDFVVFQRALDAAP